MATRVPATSPVWREVESTNIDKVGWCAEGMIVLFHTGSSYLYRGCSRQRAVALTRSASAGRYLNERIKPAFEALKIS